jgi:aspartate kinase
MENSAVSFSIVVDSSDKITKIIENLKSTYSIKYNTNLKLITIRHYNQETISELTLNKTILVEQKTRYTARYVIQNTNNI